MVEYAEHLPAGQPTRTLVALIVALAIGAAGATGIWALFSEQPGWVFTFANNANDGIFHLATGTLFAAVAAIQLAEDRTARADSRGGRPLRTGVPVPESLRGPRRRRGVAASRTRS